MGPRGRKDCGGTGQVGTPIILQVYYLGLTTHLAMLLLGAFGKFLHWVHHGIPSLPLYSTLNIAGIIGAHVRDIAFSGSGQIMILKNGFPVLK